jgi:hypothetical protein
MSADMPLTIPVLTSWTWPWPAWTLHLAYLASGLLIAAHYLPLLRRAWQYPAATATAQPLLTWSVWTLCRAVAFTYGVFELHDLVFLTVVGTDLLGRIGVAVLVVRAQAIVSVLWQASVECPPIRERNTP